MESSILTSISLTRIIIEKDNENIDLAFVTCKICSRLPIDLETCHNCRQVFCRTCLLSQKIDKKCPNCQSKFIKSPLSENQLSIFKKITINCKFFPIGCEKVCKYDELVQHEKKCSLTLKVCEICLNKITYLEYETHITECEKTNLTKCDTCGYKENKKQSEKYEKFLLHMEHKMNEKMEVLLKSHMDEIKNGLKDYIKNLFVSYQNIGEEETNDNSERIQQIEFAQDICENADNNFAVDNKFVFIESKVGDSFLVYGNENYEIEIYDSTTLQNKHIIKKAHESHIISLATCKDEKSNSYLLSGSYDRSIKVWLVDDKWNNILHIPEAHSDYSIFSIDIFYHHILNKIVIISCNSNEGTIKIWDMQKTLTEKLDEKSFTYVKTWKEQNKYFLVCCTDSLCSSYDITTNESKMYKCYRNETSVAFLCLAVNQINEDTSHLISSDLKGCIYIWDFHSADLINKFESIGKITSLDLFGNDYLLAASSTKLILVYSIKDGKLIKKLSGHLSEVFCVKAHNHPKYGKSIFSLGFDKKIKLWK